KAQPERRDRDDALRHPVGTGESLGRARSNEWLLEEEVSSCGRPHISFQIGLVAISVWTIAKFSSLNLLRHALPSNQRFGRRTPERAVSKVNAHDLRIVMGGSSKMMSGRWRSSWRGFPDTVA